MSLLTLQGHKTCSWGNHKTQQRERERRSECENSYVTKKYKQKSEERKKLGTNEGMSDSEKGRERERDDMREVEETLFYLFIFTQSQVVSK